MNVMPIISSLPNPRARAEARKSEARSTRQIQKPQCSKRVANGILLSRYEIRFTRYASTVWTARQTKPILAAEASALMMDDGLLMIWGQAMAGAGGGRSLPPNAPNKANRPIYCGSTPADHHISRVRSGQRKTKPMWPGGVRQNARYEIRFTRYAPAVWTARQTKPILKMRERL
jgi:hypothetical protein